MNQPLVGDLFGLPGSVPDDEVRRAIAYVDETGAVALIEDQMAAAKSTGAGRPRLLQVRALLVGLLLSAVRQVSVRLICVSDILHYRISPQMRTELGVPQRPDPVQARTAEDLLAAERAVEAGYATVRRLFHAIIAPMDDSELPKNRRLPDDVLEQLRTPLSADEHTLRRRLRVLVTNNLLAPSIRLFQELLDNFPGIGACVDGTPIETFARKPNTRNKIASADPDAGFYARTEDGEWKKLLWGYEATLAVSGATTEVDGEIPPPTVVLGFSVEQPGRRPGEVAIEALEQAVAHGWKPGLLAGDRAYNGQKPEVFQQKARDMGFSLLFDYTVGQFGIAAQHDGAIQVEGRWYSPGMPKGLINASLDLRHGRIDYATWQARIEARRAYELKPRKKDTSDGPPRWLCPAAGACPTVNCARKPRPEHDHARPTVMLPDPAPVDGMPKICAQQSITIPEHVGAKHAQAMPYGTPEWNTAYHTLRNGIEGTNGYLKDPTHCHLESPSRRVVRGMAAATFLLAFQLAAGNLKKYRDLRTSPNTRERKITNRRRRRHQKRAASKTAA